jgi:hypothetical protein
MNLEDERLKRAEQRRKTAERIEAERVKVLAALKANVAGLTDAEWKKLKREEDHRRWMDDSEYEP